jgi:hypothetical protein
LLLLYFRDRKKKKFVNDGGLDQNKKKIRTESGALISASYKSSAYPLIYMYSQAAIGLGWVKVFNNISVII